MTTATPHSTSPRPTVRTAAAAFRTVGGQPVPCVAAGRNAAPPPPGPAALTVTVERSARGTRLQLDGELEATTAPLLDCLVADALDRRGGEVLLDLSRTGFCDVRGLDCLLDARRGTHARGRRLVLCGAAPLLQHLLRLSGAGDVIVAGA